MEVTQSTPLRNLCNLWLLCVFFCSFPTGDYL